MESTQFDVGLHVTPNAKVLFAGPWVGEFSWELFCWQAHVRSISKNFDHTVVCSLPGRDLLYKDFADEYIPYIPSNIKAGQRAVENKFEGVSKDQLRAVVPPGTNWLFGYDVNIDWTEGFPVLHNQEYIPLGEPRQQKYDVVFYAREAEYDTWKNWGRNKWLDLYSRFDSCQSVAWVGDLDYSFATPGARQNDLRGKPLDRLVDILREAKVIVGPPSGLLHLASLCETPRVSWTPSEDDQILMLDYWNPFAVDTRIIESSDPKVDRVFDNIQDVFSGEPCPF